MGQYKVPQNVESEDKIIGALTLKQFLYTVAGVVIGAVSFLTMRKTPVVMLIVGLPPTALFLLLGLYQRQDQPFEALFLSLVGFMTKPRKRIWTKEPIEEVFKIEPPKIVKEVTQRSPEEVRGQLERLSQIVDTRGWGNKKAELQEPSDDRGLENEGRIVAPALPDQGEPIETDISMADDILDFKNNPTAHNLSDMIQGQVKTIRDEAMSRLRRRQATDTQSAAESYNAGETFQPQTASAAPTTAATTDPVPTPAPAPQAPPVEQSASGMTANPLDAILKAAMENDDLTVSQIAAQANRSRGQMAEGQSVSLREDEK